jgi:hypothetical protein
MIRIKPDEYDDRVVLVLSLFTPEENNKRLGK